jgi:hypothetical protein
MVNEDLLDYLVRMIRPFFPMNACIISNASGGDYIIEIDWNLESTLNQPNMRSKKIRILISEHTIQEYLCPDQQMRELNDIKLKNLIIKRYNLFNPYHNAGTTRFTPTEHWVIPQDVFNA